ncbi:MAG: hypothetical protein JRI97_03930 [Deltaproteobacteria bacterium]|nr:hypothetical protein [Deltaproteobacteria bacterium]
MGFDEKSAMVGTSASDKMGGDAPGYVEMDPGSIAMEPSGGLGGADDLAMSGATGDGLADNTSVGSIPTAS